jgi:outer membrane protein OmpA-like peptidoglycan-associated protein
MRNHAAALLLLLVSGCAADRASGGGGAAAPRQGTVLRAAELARVGCLLVAPFENASDVPIAADAATGALLSGVDRSPARAFPVAELRALFRDTPLELPQGIAPSLAFELAQLVGADAALWGSVEGRAADGSGELLVTMRLALTTDHQLLFADTALVRLAPGHRTETAVRRAVLEAAAPMLARLGGPAPRRCFDADRSRALRRFAVGEGSDARVARAAAPASLPRSPASDPRPPPEEPAATRAPPGAPQAEPRTPRQADWAKRLAGGGRVHVEDVSFAGRSTALQRDAGLADLAVVLLARPTVNVRIEGFVDATSDLRADQKLSAAMAQAAGKRLVELGVLPQRVTWVGRGGEGPVLPNFTARGRAANRRIEAVAVRDAG